MKQEQASVTAFTVAQGILYIARNPDYSGLVSEAHSAACERILAASPEGQRYLKQLDSTLFRAALPVMQGLLMPGIALHYVLRKRYIEEATRAALADGYTQVISLGAGFDTLTWRLHADHPETNFIEIDHPATSAVKRTAIDAHGDNLNLLAVDLAEHDLVEVLQGSDCFDPARRTLYICEGVLMYLPPAAVEALFAKLRQLSGDGTRFVFTAVAPMDSPANNTGPLLRLYLNLKNEPLAWSLEQGELAAFVARQGYRLLDDANDTTLAPGYLAGMRHGTLHQGEFLAVTEAG